MNWIWGLGGEILALLLVLLLALLLLVLLFPIRGFLQIEKVQKQEQITLEFRLLAGLIKIKREIPFVKLESSFRNIQVRTNIHKKTTLSTTDEDMTFPIQNDNHNPNWMTLSMEKVQHWYQMYHQVKDELAKMKPLMLRIVKTIQVDELAWTTTIGTGDAPESGVIAGILWAVKGCVIGLLYHYLSVQRSPVIDVKPNFCGKTLQIHVNCIFHLWLGKAMLAGLKLGVLLLREGLPWQNIQSKG